MAGEDAPDSLPEGGESLDDWFKSADPTDVAEVERAQRELDLQMEKLLRTQRERERSLEYLQKRYESIRGAANSLASEAKAEHLRTQAARNKRRIREATKSRGPDKLVNEDSPDMKIQYRFMRAALADAPPGPDTSTSRMAFLKAFEAAVYALYQRQPVDRDLEDAARKWIVNLTESKACGIAKTRVSSDLSELGWPVEGGSQKSLQAAPSKQIADFSASFEMYTSLLILEFLNKHGGESNQDRASILKAFQTAIKTAAALIADPLKRRFSFHFLGSRSTNRIDRPQWPLRWVVDALKSHLPFMRSEAEQVVKRLLKRCSAVVLAASGDSAAGEMRPESDGNKTLTRFFVSEIVALVCCRIERDLSVIQKQIAANSQSDNTKAQALCRQIIDQVLSFERRLKSGIARRSEYHGKGGASETVLKPLIQGDHLTLWLQTEKGFANEELQVLRSAERPWKPIGIGANEEGFIAPAGSECSRTIIKLMEEFMQRFSRISNPQDRLRFGVELERPLVQLVLAFARDSLSGLSKAAAKAAGEDKKASWDDFCGLLMSMEVLNSRLQIWAELPLYLNMQKHEQSQDKEDSKLKNHSKGFWEKEKNDLDSLIDECVSGITDAFFDCTKKDLRPWKVSGHKEVSVSQSPPTFAIAFKNISWRRQHLSTLLRSSLMWPAIESGVFARIDNYLVQYAVSNTAFTWNGLKRLQTECMAIGESLGSGSNLPRTSELIGLSQLSKGKISSLRAKVEDSSITRDQEQMILREERLGALSPEEVLKMCRKLSSLNCMPTSPR